MKKTIMIAMAAAMMTACSNDIADEAPDNYYAAAKNALLQVTTRGTGDANAATVSYPVQVYVFQGEECKAVQTIGDAGQTLNIALTEGTYSVYAIGGAASASYNLPAKEDATTSTALTLKEGVSMTDLMAASATATLVDGGTNTVTLGLTRKVMLLQDITISQVPTTATAVSVTIAPLWQNVTAGGTYSGTSGSTTIALTKQSDNRTWTASANAYLLPPSSTPASISVNITIGGTTKSYTYSTSDELEAGYKINISGTYTEAVGVSLTGNITGATWIGERTISFDFDENGANGTNGNNESDPNNNTAATDYPAAGSTYQGCYVLAADVADDGQSAELTLLSPSETVCVGTEAAVTATLATLGTAAVSGWELPTKSQM
ncbi:MAG: FimB/Mfa2 family fimbrial subunit, partial [Bacteroidales bacterium]|nr:FimB/Mfa2 family fimbrial subunit [Bacteroidales bacterium]